jgi:hypothetical protein
MRLDRFILGLAALLSPSIGVAAEAPGGPASSGAAPCSYFVATTGSDRNDGMSAATPFASLEKAQAAVRRASKKVVCLRAGVHHRSDRLTLTAADNGETWQYYPPDGINSAVLDGGNRVDWMIDIKGGSGITINGLKLQNFTTYGVIVDGGGRNGTASGNTVENCDAGFNSVSDWNSGGIYFWGDAPRSTIRHNYVHDVGSMGIGLNPYDARESIDGSVIAGNVVLRTAQRVSDSGAIYVSGHGGTQSSHVSVTGNLVRDYGAPGVTKAIGIYLDDNASHVTVVGNVVGPAATGAGNGVTGIFLHNGHDNHVGGNIIDLGSSARQYTVQWGHDHASIAGMGGNSFTGNIVISNFSGKQNTVGYRNGYSYIQSPSTPASWYSIQNNVYHNRGGGQVRTDGPVAGDSNPILENPQISDDGYTIASGSRVFAGPVNFPPIAGGWGPPGFVVPQRRTPQSSQQQGLRDDR